MPIFEDIFSYISSLYSPTNKSERLSAIRNTIMSLLNRKMSRTGIIEGYRSIGWGVSNQSFNQLFRDYSLTPVGRSYWQKLGVYDVPDINQFSITSRPFTKGTNFRYVGNVTYSDPNTGDETTVRMAVDMESNSQLSEIIKAMQDRMCNSDVRFCDTVVKMDIFAGYRRT